MLRSMTGFGRGSASFEDGSLSCEIRSVNHRFCDIKVRASRDLLPLEAGIIARIRDRLGRGAIEVSLRWEPRPGGQTRFALDEGLLDAYREQVEAIAGRLGVAPAFDPMAVAAVEGVLCAKESRADPEAVRPALEAAVDEALGALLAMRQKEGEALQADLRQRTAGLRTLAGEIETLAEGRAPTRANRLEARLAELLGDRTLDPDRLALEVALLAEKADVSEEVTRLQTHLMALDALLQADEPVGRRIDFLIQELNRETNTVGSKAQDPDLSTKVMDLKAEIERVREQVQNVE